ncbi:MAG: oligosaccharide flippase family protein, partial [Chitinivibrionales bacterium]|nr:oligosaccharide flippase family protein [Chitinivibrionales bacterium]
MNWKNSLTYKASLTFISQLLQQGTRLVTGFVITPILLRGLGAELYGVWTMIQQSIGYISLSDLRPMSTLRYTLAISQHKDDLEEKRRHIGAAFRIWFYTFPIFCVIGILAIWKLPFLIHVKPQYLKDVQIAIGILAFCAAMEKLFSLPSNVMRGMNLDYKYMGLSTITILLNAGIIIAAIQLGFGLPGIAAATFFGILFSGIIRLWVTRNTLSWFGMSKPKKDEFLRFARLTGWLTVSAIGGLLLTASDTLLIGYMLEPSKVAVYVITGMVLLILIGQMMQLLNSGGTGLAGICG